MNDKHFETLDPENWEEMRELAHQIVEDALDYIEHAGERPAWTPVPDDVRERLQAPAPRGPSEPRQV